MSCSKRCNVEYNELLNTALSSLQLFGTFYIFSMKMPGPLAPGSKHTSASYIEVEPQGHSKQNATKEVSAQYITCPVISKVDA